MEDYYGGGLATILNYIAFYIFTLHRTMLNHIVLNQITWKGTALQWGESYHISLVDASYVSLTYRVPGKGSRWPQ